MQRRINRFSAMYTCSMSALRSRRGIPPCRRRYDRAQSPPAFPACAGCDCYCSYRLRGPRRAPDGHWSSSRECAGDPPLTTVESAWAVGRAAAQPWCPSSRTVTIGPFSLQHTTVKPPAWTRCQSVARSHGVGGPQLSWAPHVLSPVRARGEGQRGSRTGFYATVTARRGSDPMAL